MKKYLFVLSILLVFLIAACTQQTSTITAEETVEVPEIVAQNQQISNNVVIVEDVHLDKPGYIVIHKVVDNAPGPVIGNSALLNGEVSNVEVAVTDHENEDELIAMLHYDNGDGIYEFPGDDTPVVLNGAVVMQKFSITGTTAEVPAPGHAEEVVNDATGSAVAGSAVVEINMIAKQWDFDPATVTVKEGDNVVLNIESIDVAHGIAIPDFGVSQRLEPGKTATVEFVADKKGTYTFFCNVFCGSGHGGMRGTLLVE